MIWVWPVVATIGAIWLAVLVAVAAIAARVWRQQGGRHTRWRG